jgi:hypothetical protein
MAIAPAVFVGIDVAKDELVVAARPMNESWVVPNDDSGIEQLVARLRRAAPALVVLEATGGYERAVVAALAAASVQKTMGIVPVTPFAVFAAVVLDATTFADRGRHCGTQKRCSLPHGIRHRASRRGTRPTSLAG